MPVGKYYCDYCDKEFQDTAAARRRHLLGVVRTTPFETPLLLIQGSCQYGDSCRYYHPAKNTLDVNTQAMEAKGFVGSQFQGVTGSISDSEASVPVMFGNQLGTSLGNLPPSLWPPPEGGYPPSPSSIGDRSIYSDSKLRSVLKLIPSCLCQKCICR